MSLTKQNIFLLIDLNYLLHSIATEEIF